MILVLFLTENALDTWHMFNSTVNYPPTAIDDVDGNLTDMLGNTEITCDTQPEVDPNFSSVPLTGAWGWLNWQIGTYDVTCSATDAAGNTGSSTFTITFTENTDNVPVYNGNWTIAEVQWVDNTYLPSGVGIVRIIDSDMNLDPEAIDNFDVDVWSDSDAGGIDLTVTETNTSSGIFEGTVFFTVSNDSSGHRIKVAEGDTVTAEYEDNTLPEPYTTADALDISATTIISAETQSNITFTNPRTVDAFGNSLNAVSVDQQVQISADTINNNSFENPFTYAVKIKKQTDNLEISEAWIAGSLSPGQSFTPSLSWIPEQSGTYIAEISLYDTIDNKNKLSPSLIRQIVVGNGIFIPIQTPVSPVPTPTPVSTNTIGAVEESGFSQSCVETGCYTPLTAVVNYGDTVTMTNTDPTGVHTFTSGTVNGFTPNPSQIFDSGVLMSGDSVEWTANVSGEVPYYCMLHTWMVGTIVVQGSAPVVEPTPVTITSNFEVNTIRGPFDIAFSIKGGTVENMVLSNVFSSLLVYIDSKDNGVITLDLPREFIDSKKQDGTDDVFFVLVDNTDVYFEEITTSTDRNLTINFSVDSKQIEIIYGSPTPESTVDTSNDYLTITGSITNYDSQTTNSVTWTVIDPNGNVVAIGSITPNSNGNFNEQVGLNGPLIQSTGTYTIQANWGYSVYSTSTFYYEPGVGTITNNIILQNNVIPEPVPVPVDIQTNIITTAPGSAFSTECASTSQGCFIPKIEIVSVGSTVTFSNTDSNKHTFTSGNPSDEVIGTEFNSGMLSPGDSAQWIPENVGEFSYFDMIHPWMQGTIIVQGSGPVVEPTPQPVPEPVSLIDLDISISKTTYDLGDLVGFSINGNNFSGTQNVSVDVTDPRGNTVVSRSINISPNTSGEIEFRLSENFKTGTYKITATTYDNGKTISEKSYFKLQSQFNSFTISDVMVSDQQGNTSTLQAGEMGFIKVNLSSTKSIETLVTVNLFDSELTSIGIGSVQTTLASGESEIILSFMIPEDAAIGPADIYVNAFSDWPSSGGTALTGELASMEDIS